MCSWSHKKNDAWNIRTNRNSSRHKETRHLASDKISRPVGKLYVNEENAPILNISGRAAQQTSLDKTSPISSSIQKDAAILNRPRVAGICEQS